MSADNFYNVRKINERFFVREFTLSQTSDVRQLTDLEWEEEGYNLFPNLGKRGFSSEKSAKNAVKVLIDSGYFFEY